VGAACGKAARADLGGGREVTRVPTAKKFTALREAGCGTSRKWCHRRAMSEMHRLADIKLIRLFIAAA